MVSYFSISANLTKIFVVSRGKQFLANLSLNQIMSVQGSTGVSDFWFTISLEGWEEGGRGF